MRTVTRTAFWRRVDAAARSAELGAARFEGDTPERQLRRKAEAVVLPRRYNELYLPHYFPMPAARFHGELQMALEASRRTVVRAPRGHAKSTTITFAYTHHQVVCSEVLKAWVDGKLRAEEPALFGAILEVMAEELVRRQADLAGQIRELGRMRARPIPDWVREKAAELEAARDAIGEPMTAEELQTFADGPELAAALLEGAQQGRLIRLWWDPYIQIVSVTVDQAEEFTAAIKVDLLENALVKSDWGEVLEVSATGVARCGPDKDWVSRNNGVRVKAFGMRGNIRGGKHLQWRPTLAIFDDPDSEETVTTLNMRIRQRKKLTAAAAYGLEPRVSRVFAIGTPVHADCIVCHIPRKKAEKKGFERWLVLAFKAIQEDGSPLWPERWSLELLEAERADDPESFEMEMMDVAPNDSANPFTELHEFQRTDLEGEVVARMLIFDPALGRGPKSDLQALVELAFTAELILVWDAWLTRIADPLELVEHVNRVYAQVNPDMALVEAISLGSLYESLLTSMGDRSGLFPGYVRIERQEQGKDLRIRGLAPLVNRGTIRFAKDVGSSGVAGVRRQALDYPHGKVDALDAVEMGVRRWRTIHRKKSRRGGGFRHMPFSRSTKAWDMGLGNRNEW